MMFSKLSSSAAALVLTAWIGLAPAYAVDAALLKAPWFTGDTITGENLKTISDLAQNDPEAAKLFQEAMDFLKVKTFDEMAQYFTVCPADPDAGSTNRSWTGGKTTVGRNFLMKGRRLDDIAKKKSVEYTPEDYENVVRIDDNTEDFKVTTVYLKELLKKDEQDAGQLVAVKFICFSPGTVVESYETVMHEFTHMTRKNYVTMKEPSEFTGANVREVAFQMIAETGSEIDAYKMGISSKIKLTGSRDSVASIFKSYFDDTGAFVGNNTEFGNIILGIYKPPGVQVNYFTYLQVSSDSHGDGLVKELNLTISDLNFLSRSREVMRKNANTFKDNNEEYENIAIKAVQRYTDRLRDARKKVDFILDKISAYNNDPDATVQHNVTVEVPNYD